MQFLKRITLQTRINRALLVALVLCMAFGTVYVFQRDRLVHPEERYFYTTEGGGVDIRSPTKNIIIEEDIKSDVVSRAFGESNLRRKIRRCSAAPFLPKWYYREIELCNTAMKSGGDFEIRYQYFTERVDEIYWKYYEECTERILTGFFYGLATWTVIVLTTIVVKWVLKPTA